MSSEVAQLSAYDRAYAWFDANKKQVSWGAAVLLFAGLVVGFFLYQRNQKETDASEALSTISTPMLGQAGARADSADAYFKIASQYPNSSAAARALLLGAGSLFVEGKYGEARTQFEKFAREHRQSPLMSQALLGIAACLDAQGKTNEATTAYKNIVDRHSGENVAPQARFALARLYEAQGKPEQAHTLYEDVARNDPYGSLGSEAGMRSEELKVKYPQLAAPVAPPPTISAPVLTAPSTSAAPVLSNSGPATPVSPPTNAPPAAAEKP